MTIRGDDEFPLAVGHDASQGSELIKKTGSFSGYLLGMCPPGETSIEVKLEVLHTGRPRRGSIAYVQFVGDPSASGEDTAMLLAALITTIHFSAYST